MRSIIRNRIPLSEEEKNDLWENATFVFDTNVLLDLYRASDKYADELISVITEKSPNIWLPNQVVLEFGKNRWNIIYENDDRYSPNGKINQAISSLKEACKDNIDSRELKKLESFLDTWLDELRTKNTRICDPFSDDILEKLLQLFDGKVGKGFSDDKLSEIKKLGATRYENKIPPGYKDGGKDINEYGDLIIWKEIIEYSKNNDVDIIFITQDKKEDWWDSRRGRTIGPRYELREEFFSETKHVIHFYSTDRFLEENSKRTKKKADKDIIEEAVKLSNSNSYNIDLSDNYRTIIQALLEKYGNELIGTYDYSLVDIDEAIESLTIIQNLEDKKKRTEVLLDNLKNYLGNFREEYRPEDKRIFEQKIIETEDTLNYINLQLRRERAKYRDILLRELKKRRE